MATESALPPSTANPQDFPMMLQKPDPKNAQPTKVRVIVAGLPRMGTASISIATWKLGFGPAYHMASLFHNPNDARLWLRALDATQLGKGVFTRKDWDTLLQGCGTTCDAPCAWFTAELANAYPEAKVVVLKRDFESWYKSYEATIMKAQSSFIFKAKAILFIMFDYALLGQVIWTMKRFDDDLGTIYDKASARQFYDKYYQKVEGSIPADQRIEYSVKDGWGPLCKHLGVAVPTKEFPSSNKSDNFNERVTVRSNQALKRIMWKALTLSLLVAVPLMGLRLAGGFNALASTTRFSEMIRS